MQEDIHIDFADAVQSVRKNSLSKGLQLCLELEACLLSIDSSYTRAKAAKSLKKIKAAIQKEQP